jgi:head-tail adaptor
MFTRPSENPDTPDLAPISSGDHLASESKTRDRPIAHRVRLQAHKHVTSGKKPRFSLRSFEIRAQNLPVCRGGYVDSAR